MNLGKFVQDTLHKDAFDARGVSDSLGGTRAPSANAQKQQKSRNTRFNKKLPSLHCKKGNFHFSRRLGFQGEHQMGPISMHSQEKLKYKNIFLICNRFCLRNDFKIKNNRIQKVPIKEICIFLQSGCLKCFES